MRVFGIDPGSLRTGWGVIDAAGTRITHVASGMINAGKTTALPERLRRVHTELRLAVDEHRPDAIAVEDIFFARHANAALKLGHARGVALLVAAQQDLPVFEYEPAVIKRTVVGRGRAEKRQVAALVTAILGLTSAPQADAADALAVAITHAQAHRGNMEARLRPVTGAARK